VVGTKIDITGDGTRLHQLQTFCKGHRYKYFPISAATRDGLTELVTYVGLQVESLRHTPCETNS
jgi:GTP-binding protein